MISVRSEVQVFPGPPAFAALQLRLGRSSWTRLLRRSAGKGERTGDARQEAFVFWYGAIAQLGERVLCKHEVVGSIPSGSTTLRPLGFAWRSHAGEKAKRARRSSRERRRADDRLKTLSTRKQTSAKTSLCVRCPNGRACGIFDIVKRRSIRVWDLRSNSRNSNHYLRDVSALVHRQDERVVNVLVGEA